MDVGRIITAQIKVTFFKPRGKLFFPFIVTRLCLNMCFMEKEPEVAVKGVLTNQVLRRLLRDSPHLVEAAKTKNRLAKSPKTSSP